MLARVTDRLSASIQSRIAQGGEGREAGMTTAEYAVGTVAAAGCGGVLYQVVKSDHFLSLVTKLLSKAFSLF